MAEGCDTGMEQGDLQGSYGPRGGEVHWDRSCPGPLAEPAGFKEATKVAALHSVPLLVRKQQLEDGPLPASSLRPLFHSMSPSPH